jgi:Spy/CpxP family protein refolding chaperone
MKSIRNWLAGTVLTAGALVSAGAVLSVANAADTTPSAAPAAGDHPDWKHHGHHRGGFMYARLGLTDAQKAQIKTLHQQSEPQMKTLFQQMRGNSAKLQGMQPNDPQYLATVKEVSEANAPLKAQMEQQRAAVHQQIYSKVLTPSQQTQLQQMQAQWKARMQQHAAGGPAT